MLPKKDIEFIRNDPETAKTQLVIVVGLLVIAAIFDNATPAYIALIVGLVCLIVPPAGHWLVWGWFKLAEILSRIVNPLVLGVLYYTFITPIALLFRLFGNDPMRIKDKKGSLYEIREKTYQKEDLKNPW